MPLLAYSMWSDSENLSIKAYSAIKKVQNLHVYELLDLFYWQLNHQSESFAHLTGKFVLVRPRRMKVNCQLSLTRILHTRMENHLLKQQPRQFVFTDHLSVQLLHYLCTAIRTKKRNRKRTTTRCDVDDNSFFSEIERKCAYHTSEKKANSGHLCSCVAVFIVFWWQFHLSLMWEKCSYYQSGLYQTGLCSSVG